MHHVECKQCDFERDAHDWLAAEIVAEDHRDREGHVVTATDPDGSIVGRYA
jgi:hypothetical protein